jgi:SAM-dependent methyltransferase
MSQAKPILEDDENLVLAESADSVDEVLSKFYGRYPWPWQAMKFDYLSDPDLETVLLNQDLGDWEHKRIPERPKVWVAGCGTNQALMTALRFPKGTVIGTDVSEKSLELCRNAARDAGVTNLELRLESINKAGYEAEFDYVICTGVIHHNAHPEVSLERLARALKPDGILELMVYNRFHRTLTSAFQKTIRILTRTSGGQPDFESGLALAKKLLANFPVENHMSEWLAELTDRPEADLADLLIQPVEHSYTVASLSAMAEGCGLEMLQPCITLYVKLRLLNTTWNMEFADAELQSRYDALPDLDRWQVSNLLLHEKTPLLWFFLQRRDGAHPRKTEREIDEEFMDGVFEKVGAQQGSFIKGGDGIFKPSKRAVAFPLSPPEESVRTIFKEVDGQTSMREIFRKLKIEPTVQNINKARRALTTVASPYLRAVRRETR